MYRIDDAVALILRVRAEVPPTRAALVAISGIDGAGKGYAAGRIATQLARSGNKIARIDTDEWRAQPVRRYTGARAAERYYEHGVRFDALFQQLVLPLRDRRCVRIQAELADAIDGATRPQRYELDEVDVVVLDGAFLLKRFLRAHYDVALWVDCSVETAQQRVLARFAADPAAQDGLRGQAAVGVAAQRLHLLRDNPRAAADLIIDNDEDAAHLSGPGHF
jgi:uridine kinase